MVNIRDIFVTGIILIGCGLLYIATTNFEEVSAMLGSNVLPEQFPRMLLWIIAGLSLLLPFEHKFQPDRWKKIDATRSKPLEKTTWASIAFILLVVLVAPWLGITATMFGICVALPLLWGDRRIVLILIFAIVFTAVVTYLFNTVLKVHFEPGIFSRLFSN